MDCAAWWDAWVRHHAAVYGLDTEGGLDMLYSWPDLLRDSDYTEAEFYEATRRLAGNPPRYRSEHFARVRAEIAAVRREARGAVLRDPRFADWRCQECDGSGLVPVPSARPQCWEGGHWRPVGSRWYEAVATCVCEKGEALHAGLGERGVLSLAQYEDQFPRWREELQRGREQQGKEAGQRAKGQREDQRSGPLLLTPDEALRRLRERSGN